MFLTYIGLELAHFQLIAWVTYFTTAACLNGRKGGDGFHGWWWSLWVVVVIFKGGDFYGCGGGGCGDVDVNDDGGVNEHMQ